MIIKIEGGMSDASVPEAAIQPADRRLSYPNLVISGIAILVNTAAFTIVDPQAAPNAAEARVVAIARPPEILPSQLYAAL